MPRSELDALRRSILVTLDEIRAREAWLRENGADVTDLGEWMQLRDVVARIERRLLANLPNKSVRSGTP